MKEISTSVTEVFGQSGIAGLESRDDILIAACRLREMDRGLRISFHHQRGHQAVSYNEFARYNARADALATRATTSPTEK